MDSPTITTTTSPPLPTSRTLLTTLLHLLSKIPPPPDSPPQPSSPPPHHHQQYHPNPPNSAPSLPDSTKPLLLTLHSLLPHCLLPALDLLDRGLVERWIPSIPTSSSSSSPNGQQKLSPPPSTHVYYMSTTTSHTHHAQTSTLHEVRPYTWSCTCTNFCVYAFFDDIAHPHPDAHTPQPQPTSLNSQSQPNQSWTWGGPTLLTTPSTHIPVCKHLLAAVLVEQCPSLFGKHVKERRGIGREEMAGAAAGF